MELGGGVKNSKLIMVIAVVIMLMMMSEQYWQLAEAKYQPKHLRHKIAIFPCTERECRQRCLAYYGADLYKSFCNRLRNACYCYSFVD